MSFTRNAIAFGAIVFLAFIVLCGFIAPVDSMVRPTPTPDSDHHYWLPLMMVATPTPITRPTLPAMTPTGSHPIPTSTALPTITPTPTVYFDPSTPISTQPWVTLFPPFSTFTPTPTTVAPLPTYTPASP